MTFGVHGTKLNDAMNKSENRHSYELNLSFDEILRDFKENNSEHFFSCNLHSNTQIHPTAVTGSCELIRETSHTPSFDTSQRLSSLSRTYSLVSQNTYSTVSRLQPELEEANSLIVRCESIYARPSSVISRTSSSPDFNTLNGTDSESEDNLDACESVTTGYLTHDERLSIVDSDPDYDDYDDYDDVTSMNSRIEGLESMENTQDKDHIIYVTLDHDPNQSPRLSVKSGHSPIIPAPRLSTESPSPVLPAPRPSTESPQSPVLPAPRLSTESPLKANHDNEEQSVATWPNTIASNDKETVVKKRIKQNMRSIVRSVSQPSFKETDSTPMKPYPGGLRKSSSYKSFKPLTPHPLIISSNPLILSNPANPTPLLSSTLSSSSLSIIKSTSSEISAPASSSSLISSSMPRSLESSSETSLESFFQQSSPDISPSLPKSSFTNSSIYKNSFTRSSFTTSSFSKREEVGARKSTRKKIKSLFKGPTA